MRGHLEVFYQKQVLLQLPIDSKKVKALLNLCKKAVQKFHDHLFSRYTYEWLFLTTAKGDTKHDGFS